MRLRMVKCPIFQILAWVNVALYQKNRSMVRNRSVDRSRLKRVSFYQRSYNIAYRLRTKQIQKRGLLKSTMETINYLKAEIKRCEGMQLSMCMDASAPVNRILHLEGRRLWLYDQLAIEQAKLAKRKTRFNPMPYLHAAVILFIVVWLFNLVNNFVS